MPMRTRMAAVLGLWLLSTAAAKAEEWQLAKDEAGIRVYLKTVPGSAYKAFRGVATITADIKKLRALQDDVGGSCAWIHECREQHLIKHLVKHPGSQSWTYTVFDTPWPVTPRDSVLRVTTVEEPDGGLTRTLEGVPDYLPEANGLVRVSKVQGIWKMTPKGGDAVEVLYEVHSEPGGSVPSWLANSFVIDAPYNTLEALRRLAEKP